MLGAISRTLAEGVGPADATLPFDRLDQRARILPRGARLHPLHSLREERDPHPEGDPMRRPPDEEHERDDNERQAEKSNEVLFATLDHPLDAIVTCLYSTQLGDLRQHVLARYTQLLRRLKCVVDRRDFARRLRCMLA